MFELWTLSVGTSRECHPAWSKTNPHGQLHRKQNFWSLPPTGPRKQFFPIIADKDISIHLVNVYLRTVWLGGRLVGMLELRSTGRGFESRPLALECNPGQVVNTHGPLTPSSIFDTSQWVVMPCGWEGNRRSGVALATRHTLVVLHLRAQSLGEGDEHPSTLS